MFWKRSVRIKPYGYDWNGDRGAPDYDPQRDPWFPGSPVFGQWPRHRWLRKAVEDPILWAFFAWFVVTSGLMGLHAIGAISNDTLLVGWIAKYLVLFTGLALIGVWSAVAWYRRTPPGERGPAFRQKLRQAPQVVAWLAAGTTVLIGLDILEKQYGVPFLVSFGALAVVGLGIIWWRTSREPSG